MTESFGLLAAFIAFLSWGFGDFFIQRSVRAVGVLEALFWIGVVGMFGLLPFVWTDLPLVFENPQKLLLLGFTVGITFVGAIVDFEALRRGKLSIIEPVLSFELIFTAIIGLSLLGERLSAMQFLLVLLVFIGILLSVFRHPPKRWLTFWRERGVVEHGILLAGLGAILMALMNVFTGVSSQTAGPIMAIWFIHTSLAIMCFGWFAIGRSIPKIFRSAKKNWRPLLGESIGDNLAWLAYAYATTQLSITITIAITESYIALTCLLGFVFNRERLYRHQFVGIVITLTAAILLAAITG